RGEHRRCAVDYPALGGLVHVGLVGRREHVGRRAVGELLDERGRALEVVLDRHAGVRRLELRLDGVERFGERRRGEHRQCLLLSPGRAGAGARPRSTARDQQREPGQRGNYLLQRSPPGVSTTTVVAFTTATASTPGRSPSSRTASALISDTTRCGPLWISTCAMTASVDTSVTKPTNRLRAERPTPVGSATSLAEDLANAARAAPSTTLRP